MAVTLPWVITWNYQGNTVLASPNLSSSEVSIIDMQSWKTIKTDGAVVVYDAHTLEEIKRLPMSKPSGKYNVYNKTHYEEGTSH